MARTGAIYLPQALAHPWQLLQAYHGYLQLVPHAIGQVAALLPLRHALGGWQLAAGLGHLDQPPVPGHTS
jgi:hypothetical protein